MTRGAHDARGRRLPPILAPPYIGDGPMLQDGGPAGGFEGARDADDGVGEKEGQING